MKKYQVIELFESIDRKAGKAPIDISIVAENLGFQKLVIKIPTDKWNNKYFNKIGRNFRLYKEWKNICFSEKSIFLLQTPFGIHQWAGIQFIKKMKNNAKCICLIHDVEELRVVHYDNFRRKEFNCILEIADVFIVHNEVMKQFFIKKGISEDKIVVLQIFDYLQKDMEINLPDFEKSISIAGNLSTSKAPYIGQLNKLSEINVNLFGPNFNQKLLNSANVKYMGSFPSDEIPNRLTAGFGLVWDGDSIDTCSGNYGEYLRYNNPYKLSLYLSSGIPVVIWSKAAEADFVKRHGVGICVDSLYDLKIAFNSMKEEEYTQMAENVKKIRKKLIKGEYAQEAIRTALRKIAE